MGVLLLGLVGTGCGGVKIVGMLLRGRGGGAGAEGLGCLKGPGNARQPS